jgi:hypothetical protein
MNLVLLDIPEDPRQLATWLEHKLVSLELRDLVVELEAIRSSSPDKRDFDQLLGRSLPQILENGLQELAPDTLRGLLQQPRLLVDLQERILSGGGDFWRCMEITSAHQAAIDRGWSRLQAGMGSSAGGTELAGAQPLSSKANVAPLKQETQGTVGGVPQRKLIRWASAAVAVALLVAFGLWLNQPAAAPGWGWDRPGALTASLSASDYLAHLADEADEWFRKRPDSRGALETRLREFRHGCDTLLAAAHPQLADKDRNWLKEHCRAWAGKLDQHLADLAAGKDLATVQEAADETIRKLVNALRDRSLAA